MYNLTKKWGSVRLTIKRLYKETHKYKKSFRHDRYMENTSLSRDNPTLEYDTVVKAENPKRKISTMVAPKESS